MLPLGESTYRAYFGPERVYAVTVGPGQQLAVGVLTQTGDAALNFFASPSACVSGEGASCLASSDLGGEGVAEATSWRNTGATPVVVLVAVGQYSVGSWLSYALTVELR
jgi:hypothetical protein